MPEATPGDPAAAENQSRYADPVVVADYMAETYHDVRVALAARLLERSGATLRGTARVADLGAAGSHFARKISHLGADLVCCDVSEAALSGARAEGFNVLQMNVIDGFPFSTGSLDAIYAGELLEHLFDPGVFLNECRRSLKSGGILILTTPNLAGLQDRVQFIAGRSPRHVDPYHSYLKLHIRPFTAHALRRALRLSGFEPLELRSNYVRWYASRRVWESRWLARLFPTLGGSLVVSARATEQLR
jgi:SAM-dependent methyltransferase